MQIIVQSWIVQVLRVFSAGDIISIFTIFEGWPLDALNAHGFVRECWITVWNASHCCKKIFLNKDI